jgi:putative Holliday junction resolvase
MRRFYALSQSLCYATAVRVLAVDFGRRRLGLAVSDATGLLARPWKTVPAGRDARASAAALAELMKTGQDEELSEIGAIVVGLPRRLGGEDTDQTQPARLFAHCLGELTGLPVHLQDERLTSYEAESRLAERERNWRKRKPLLDETAAAIILQDYLDGRPETVPSSLPADGPGE